MIKSEERTIEYYVIIQPRHRERPPICYKGYAKDEEEASNVVFNSDWHKNILDVIVSNGYDDFEFPLTVSFYSHGKYEVEIKGKEGKRI